ncbi:MAG: extradiol ring-cleavage dioxygenase [Nitrososphaerales archaeon]
MPLVYACIAPHGGEVIPALAGDKLRLFAPTRRGMRILAKQLKDARPDTIVVASPHNLRLPKHIGVVISENSSGRVTEGAREVRLRVKCDVEMGRAVIEEAEKLGLPVVGANYGALEGRMSDLAMDWGTLIPLWFFLRGNRPKSRVLIVTPSRGIPLEQNHVFGKCIAKVAEGGRKRVAFVASSDQAHAHRKNGPYGFDPRAKVYDRAVVEAIEGQKLFSVMNLDPVLVEAAKPDSLWQMTTLAGALSVVPMTGELVSYQVPTYFGMLCAGFTRRF